MSLLEGIAIPAQCDRCTDYFPVYFQACKGASAAKSGIYLLPFSALAPAAISSGISVRATGRYRPQTWMGWVFTVTGLGLMSTVTATDTLAKSYGCLAVLGWGIGYVVSPARGPSVSNAPYFTRGRILSATSMYPIQAPLSVTQNAPALAFMWFLRSFASVSIKINIGMSLRVIPFPLGVGYNYRKYRTAERACKEAPCVVHPTYPTRSCHRIHAHPRASCIPSTDPLRSPSRLCRQSCGAVARLDYHQRRRVRSVVVHARGRTA